MDSWPAIQAVAVALLRGDVLRACNVTAGNGKVIDWRAVKSGETLMENANAFDVARAFVAMVDQPEAMAAAGAADAVSFEEMAGGGLV